MGEAVGGQSIRTGRVDLFQQRLGRGADLRLPAQQFREEKKNPFVGLIVLFAVIRQQLPDMILTVELQRQLPIGDVPPGAVERGGVLSRLLLRRTKLLSVAPLSPVVPEIIFMGSSSFIFRK